MTQDIYKQVRTFTAVEAKFHLCQILRETAGINAPANTQKKADGKLRLLTGTILVSKH